MIKIESIEVYQIDLPIKEGRYSWSNNNSVELRNPSSTRPWQHVLEPLGGYLTLAEKLSKNFELHGEAFNFGPPSHQNHSVLALVEEMSNHWEKVKWKIPNKIEDTFYESGLLKLNCDKALHFLDWKAILDFRDTVQLTAEWYKSFYENNNDVAETTNHQIKEYQKLLVKV